MQTSTLPTDLDERPRRPFGVWFLTVYALIFAGLAPALLGLYLLVTGNAAGNEARLLISIPFSLAVARYAVGAWQGSESARRSLLVFVTLHYVLVGINNYLLLDSPLVPPEEQTRLWGRILRGILYPAVFLWYFNRDTTKEFFR